MAPARPNNAKATQATQHCTCQRLCRGGQDLPPRTYKPHKKYRDADLQKTDKRRIAHSYSSAEVNSLHMQPMDLDLLPGHCSPTPSASVTCNNNDFYPDNTEEVHEDVESASNRDPITLTQEPLSEPSLEKLATLAMVQAINSAELEDDINDAELLKTLRTPTSQSDPIDKITRLSIDIFVALPIGGSQQMYNGVRNALSSHNPPIQIHSYHTVQAIVKKITQLA